MLDDIINSITQAGGRAYYVGGCVRDQILGMEPKDLDVEVFFLAADTLSDLLVPFGKVNKVGVSFGVIKLRTPDGTEFDFTLPRRENKTGVGHKGFQVEVDHTMNIREAALRRDFTINAISSCASTGELFDPHNGLHDLQQRILRATSSHFAEDPLRVLRGMQFAARFNLNIDQRTASLASTLKSEYQTLASERIWSEWHKWAIRGIVPSQGLEVLRLTGWIDLYPELYALMGVPQDPEWHPEGDVWKHTLHVCDASANIAEREQLDDFERLVLLFAALCHDLGKATATEFIDGRWRSRGHCEAGVPLTRTFLESIGCPEQIIEVIEPLVAEHLVHTQKETSSRSVRRLAHRLGKATIDQLARLIEADMDGRPPLPGGVPPAVSNIIKLANEMEVHCNRPKPLILGRHIIALGFNPDIWFSEILAGCFEAQLDGEFTTETEGIDFLKDRLKERQE